jgi:type II protein arginine methyltransferase
MVALKDAIAALEPKAAGNPAAMLGVARLMLQDGQSGRALALCRAALALAPQDRRLAAEARDLLNGTVPSWHFGIVRDQVRNAAYDAALRHAVRPGMRVLDIGTGSGLFALMAARAGAEVIACEMNPLVAETAAEIVRRNGHGERVRVIAKHSDQLDVEADLGGRVDIIVSEIASNDLLSQHILPVHEHAVRHLLKPGGQVIPACGAVRVALAEDGGPGEVDGLADVAGFDLSAFGSLAPPVRRLRSDDRRLSLRSEAADLFVFDFASAAFHPPAQSSVVSRSSGGRVNGIAQWIRLELDDVTHYENRPGDKATSCWAVRFVALPEPIETRSGQEIAIFGSYDRSSLVLWL